MKKTGKMGLNLDSDSAKLTRQLRNEELVRGTHRARLIVRGPWIAGLILAAAMTHAGELGIGPPTVESGYYRVPIVISAEQQGVAALNFRLSYDAGVFEPVAVEAGASALASGKQVTGNVAQPGEYVVVMMGFNQTAVNEGVVANVVLRQMGEPEEGLSRLTILDTALSTWEGGEIPSEGGTRVLHMGESAQEQTESSESETPESSETTDEIQPEAEDATETRSGNGRIAQLALADDSPAAGTQAKEQGLDNVPENTGTRKQEEDADARLAAAGADAEAARKATESVVPGQAGDVTTESVLGTTGVTAGAPGADGHSGGPANQADTVEKQRDRELLGGSESSRDMPRKTARPVRVIAAASVLIILGAALAWLSWKRSRS